MSAAKRIEISRAGATRLTGVNTIAVSTRMYESGERIATAKIATRLSRHAAVMAPGTRRCRNGTSTRQRNPLQPQS